MIFEELDALFQSSTIKPTFEKVHIILALYIFDENKEGIGRYRLQKELLIGEGTAKSLIKKLNENVKFITVIEGKKRKGHVLTAVGLDYLNKIKTLIPFVIRGEASVLKDIIIDTEILYTYFCLVKNAMEKITDGVNQRDAAIKVNGSGATCLVFDGINLIFPSKPYRKSVDKNQILNKPLFEYFKSKISERNSKLEKNDVITIGSGNNPQNARLATINAALTLI
ncbi:MAG: DUF4443 domain-containing protein [Promethearchaeota archaeon]